MQLPVALPAFAEHLEEIVAGAVALEAWLADGVRLAAAADAWLAGAGPLPAGEPDTRPYAIYRAIRDGARAARALIPALEAAGSLDGAADRLRALDLATSKLLELMADGKSMVDAPATSVGQHLRWVEAFAATFRAETARARARPGALAPPASE